MLYGFIIIAFVAGVEYQKWKYRQLDESLSELYKTCKKAEKSFEDHKKKMDN